MKTDHAQAPDLAEGGSSRHGIFRAGMFLFLLAVAVRLIVLGGLLSYGGEGELVLGDTERYLALAESVVEGDGYVYEDGPEAYRPPGYPAYLMPFVAFGLPLWSASVLQILIASLLPVAMLYAAVALLSLPRGVGIAAGVLAAVEPVQVFYSVVLMPDAYFAIGFLAAGFFLLRYLSRGGSSDVIWAGLCLGVANYFRPAGIYAAAALGTAVLLAMLLRKAFSLRRVGHLALFAAASVALMLPWMARNHRVFDSYAFVSSDAYVLYAYGAAQTKAVAEGREYEPVKQELLAKLSAEAPDGDRRTSLRNREWLLAQSKEVILAHPVEYLKGYVLGVNTLFFSGNYHYLLSRYKLIDPPEKIVSFSLVLAREGVPGLLRAIASYGFEPYIAIAIGGKALWALLVFLSLAGAFLLRRHPLSWMFAASVAYFAATILATTIGVEARHRYALNPLIFLFGAAVIYLLYEKALRRRSRIQ